MTERYINIHEIKAAFSKYAKQVMKGKSFIIAIRNKPFAELRPHEPYSVERKVIFGVLKKQFKVPDEFNAPIDEFEKEFYGEG
jgi:antitoxin (DNA-binding transcriptional repressor) of toxin-antitoxin stability system